MFSEIDMMLGTCSFQQPEKKNPGLTPMDWVKFLVSAAIGLVSFIMSMKFDAYLSILHRFNLGFREQYALFFCFAGYCN